MKVGANSRSNVGKMMEKDILKTLKSSKKSMSTREISIAVKKSWHTIDKHCMKLEIEHKIRSVHLGNNTLWMLEGDNI